MYKRLAVGSASFALIAGLAGCGGSGGSGDSGAAGGSPASSAAELPKPSGPPLEDGTFRLSLPFDPGSLDAVTNAGIAKQVPMYAYDALVATVDPKTIAPNLATEWELAPRKMVFTIRSGVTCSDGSPVTASTVAKSFARYKEPDAQARPFGDMSDWKVTGDDDAGTVTFTFGKPVGFPLQSIADEPVVCGKGLENPGMLKTQTSGSGPYVLKKAVPNDRYIFERRDGYTWGPDGATTDEPGIPKTVEMRILVNPTTTTNLFLSGDLDEASLPLSERERLGDDARVISAPRDLGQLLYNNDSKRPTGDANVRRALTMALDREALVTVAKGQLSNNMPLSVTNPCADPANGSAIPGHDPEQAAKLLDEAGWTMGSDGVRAKAGKRLTIESFLINDMPSNWIAAGELAARAWRELGIDVKTRTLTGSAWFQTLGNGDWDAMPLSALGSVNPSMLVALVSGAAPPKGSNYPRITNPEYDAATEAALNAESVEEACEQWNTAERALYEQANIFPLVEADRLFAMQKHVDIEANVYGVVPTSVRLYEG